jgi:cell filamentation protein
MSDDPYVYPDTRVLKNKLDLRDVRALDQFERRMVAQRIADPRP